MTKHRTTQISAPPSKARIFIQIPSYRDPELLPTLRDCIAKAKYPKNLKIGLCWQHDGTEDLGEFTNDKRFKIYECAWEDSKGLLWARHQVRKFYDNEDYSLQLDSHHRFINHWDVELVTMLRDLQKQGHKKPLISTYCGRYTPVSSPENTTGKDVLLDTDAPMKMVADQWTKGGTVLFRPHHIKKPKRLKGPIPARWVSGHFYFTIGKHCKDYLYDPNMYFAGDEMALSIRSYTLGYDLFHPHKTVVYHEYTREYREYKHWGDHTAQWANDDGTRTSWKNRNEKSLRRLRQLTKQENLGIKLGKYGLGKERTHAEFEEYAGINFSQRLLHINTRRGLNPPTGIVGAPAEEEKEHDVVIIWDVAFLKNQAAKHEFDFIYVGIEDSQGTILIRADITVDNYPSIFHMDKSGMRFKFSSDTSPHKWVLWPHSETDGWLERHDELLQTHIERPTSLINNTLKLTAKEKLEVEKGLQESPKI